MTRDCFNDVLPADESDGVSKRLRNADSPKTPDVQEEDCIFGVHAHLLDELVQHWITIGHVASTQSTPSALSPVTTCDVGVWDIHGTRVEIDAIEHTLAPVHFILDLDIRIGGDRVDKLCQGGIDAERLDKDTVGAYIASV